MIKGDESLVDKYQLLVCYFTLNHNFKKLHFDPNPIKIGYLVYRVMKNLSMLKTI